MLELTPSTMIKMLALGFNAVGRGIKDFNDFSNRMLFGVVRDTHSDTFLWKSEGGKDNPIMNGLAIHWCVVDTAYSMT